MAEVRKSYCMEQRVELIRFTDEVSALVVDIGTSSIRAGYAGDDTPKAIIPSCYGFKQEEQTGDQDITMSEPGEDGEASKKPPKKVKLYIGQNGPSVWREDMQIAYPVHNSMSASSECASRPHDRLNASSSCRLQPCALPPHPCPERCYAVHSGRASCPFDGARLEYAREPRAHGRNHVRRVSCPSILYREYWSIERVSSHLCASFGLTTVVLI